MPYFSLSVQKKEQKKKNNNTIKYQIIEKDVQGIVNITLSARYIIKVKDIKYHITKESYSCKNKNNIYHQLCGNNSRICYIRYVDKKYECNSKLWLPFAPGCIVKGNIIQGQFEKLFAIKKVWIDPDNIDAHNAFQFFKENYDIISEQIKKNLFNGI